MLFFDQVFENWEMKLDHFIYLFIYYFCVYMCQLEFLLKLQLFPSVFSQNYLVEVYAFLSWFYFFHGAFFFLTGDIYQCTYV